MESEINEIENISIINENGDEIIDTKTSLTYVFQNNNRNSKYLLIPPPSIYQHSKSLKKKTVK